MKRCRYRGRSLDQRGRQQCVSLLNVQSAGVTNSINMNKTGSRKEPGKKM
jgi:hypothetical protein